MKKTQKLLTLFLCLCMAMAFIPLTAFATGTADDWDGTADTSWYGAADSQSSYRLSTAAQFAGLAELVNAGNDFSSVTLILTSDINLLDQEWTPVGKGYMARSPSSAQSERAM